VRQTDQGTLFVQPLNGARQLAIAGDFNDWSPQATPFKRNEQLDVWEACIPLKPGKYHYRLVADEKWMNDPHTAGLSRIRSAR
jgi:1,4-alpha-glucan branching enzyme